MNATRLAELKAKKNLVIPQSQVEQFRNYANKNNVYPCGGAILPNNMRVLYLD